MKRPLKRQRTKTICLSFVLCSVSPFAVGESPRARPPIFPADEREVFFDNALEQLVGTRPDYGKATPATAEVAAASNTEQGNQVAWADLVETDTLETEIKRQTIELSDSTRSVAGYRAGAYRQAADALGLSAALFAVTSEHSGEPRWRDIADGLRELLATSLEAADQATEAGYAVASARAMDLQDLVRGGRPSTPVASQPVDWSTLASRGGLMRRMGTAEAKRLKGWVADRREFSRHTEDVRHEAQMLALLAEAIVRPGAYDGDDPDYQAYAQQLREAAGQLASAAEDDNHEAAQRVMPELSRSCVDCHADYRG